MNKSRMTVFTCLASLSLLLTLLVATLMGSPVVRGGIAHAATAQKCGQWSIIPSANSQAGSILNDVAVITAKDIWAVGLYISNQGYSQTFAEHWDGGTWKAVSTPNKGSLGNYLSGVVAFSPTNVWAVGYYQSKSGAFHTLVEHWDGSAWKIVASPNVGASDNFLFHVAAVTSNDMWAVGYSTNSAGLYQTLVEQWDGSAWKVVASPNVSNEYNMLNGVTVVSKNDIWSVGWAFGSSIGQTLTEHWNGSRWQIVASPNPGAQDNGLWGVAAVATNDVWAIGNTIGRNNQQKTLVEHWNGKNWKVVASPTPKNLQNLHAIPNSGGEPTTLFGLAVISATNIWAVGDYINSNGIYQTMIEQWNGKQWSLVPSPNLGSDDTYLRSAARVGNTSDVWAVGYGTANGNSASSLTEYYC